ncbi:hypothetical protein [Dictyobacter formicarum]|uniref:Uncharacterized protein n=1 Tax=Dictyobacter formicarum TaxID=2778368 RepID=A0ABQ3VLQ3_9CHLR|nr:hypothetical protein [Dictyobacter formicarum]GHO87155.1 hypothetical protein KSZ_51610 [Dictyobacter formicarum]
MRLIRSPKVWIPLTLVLLLFTLPAGFILAKNVVSDSGPASSLCSKQAFASGTIVRLDGGKRQSTIREDIGIHDSTQASDPSLAGVNLIVGVNSSTRVFRQQGNECKPAPLSNLKTGQKIKVWSKSGMVLNSYPGRLVDTTDIVIVA